MKSRKQVRLPAKLTDPIMLKGARTVFEKERAKHGDNHPLRKQLDLVIKEINYRLAGGDRRFKIKPKGQGYAESTVPEDNEALRKRNVGPSKKPAKPKKKARTVKKGKK